MKMQSSNASREMNVGIIKLKIRDVFIEKKQQLKFLNLQHIHQSFIIIIIF